jgi:transcriptional regulator GlxA family with amidase domain
MTPTTARCETAGPPGSMTTMVALVVYPGVLANECHAVRSVFERLDGVHIVTIAGHRGAFSGPGGVQHADEVFAAVAHPHVVIVPGGLGCREAAEDATLQAWLRSVEPTCRWIVAVSTGTVALAAAGIVRDHAAVTHWLAGDLLAEFGAERAEGRALFDGKVVTCAGAAAAREAALQIVEHEAGRDAAERIRAELAASTDPAEPRRRRWPFRRAR